MRPVASSTLYNKGLQCVLLIHIGIILSTHNGSRVVKVALVAVTCNLPARALVLNMNQIKGSYSCHLCEDKGSTEDSKNLVSVVAKD